MPISTQRRRLPSPHICIEIPAPIYLASRRMSIWRDAGPVRRYNRTPRYTALICRCRYIALRRWYVDGVLVIDADISMVLHHADISTCRGYRRIIDVAYRMAAIPRRITMSYGTDAYNWCRIILLLDVSIYQCRYINVDISIKWYINEGYQCHINVDKLMSRYTTFIRCW
jgi:hypothetical protein